MRIIIREFGPYNMPVLTVDYEWIRINGEMMCFDLRLTMEKMENLAAQGRYDHFAAMTNRHELEGRRTGRGKMPLWGMTGFIVEMSDSHWFERYGVRYARPADPVGLNLLNEPIGSWDEEDNRWLAGRFNDLEGFDL